jgi:phage baseplate assembly protein W
MIIIDTSQKRELTLAPETETDAKVQELYILICTIQGECPMYRDFGVSNDYLHMPVNAAETAMTLAITEALRRYMPDVELESIRFERNEMEAMQGILRPVLEVSDFE